MYIGLQYFLIKSKKRSSDEPLKMVRVTGLEPALLSEAAPKTAVYANFTTPAYYSIFDFQPIGIIRKSTTVVTLPKSNVSALLAQQACSHTPAYYSIIDFQPFWNSLEKYHCCNAT